MADISKFLQRAEQAYKTANYQYAVQLYLEALQVEPADIEARKMLRSVLLKADEKGTKIDAPKGQTIVLSRDPKVQLAEYEKAVVKEPKNAKYNRRVADALRQIGAHEAAGFVYDFIITYCDKGKDDVESMKSGAQAYIDAGKPELAQRLLVRAMKAAPSDKEIADLQRNLAASSTLSRISGASSSRDMLKDSGQAMELELLNKKVLSPDEIKTAMKIVNAKLEAAPTDKALIKKKAELFGKARHYDKAYDFLVEKYRDLDSPADLMEAAVAFKKQHFEFQIKRAEHKIKEDPANEASYREQIKEAEAGKLEFELSEYRRQVNEAPADLDKRYNFGRALFESARYDEALEHLQRAARSPKNGRIASIYLARCFSRTGQPELGVRKLQEMREQISPVEEDLYAVVRYWLADSLEAQARRQETLGQTDPAKESFTAARKGFEDLFMENARFRPDESVPDVKARLDSLQAVG